MLQVQNQFQCLLLILASGLFDNYRHHTNQQKVLSDRELEVLSHLAYGKTAKKIGIELGISSRTVEHHIENIKNKTNCSSRAELIEMCWAGLMACP